MIDNDTIVSELQKIRKRLDVLENSGKGEWCCVKMKNFAEKNWLIDEPIENKVVFRILCKIKEMAIIYCPFCGVKLL